MILSNYIKSRRIIMIFDSELQKQMILEIIEAHPKLGIQGDLQTATQYIANLQALKMATTSGLVVAPADISTALAPPPPTVTHINPETIRVVETVCDETEEAETVCDETEEAETVCDETEEAVKE